MGSGKLSKYLTLLIGGLTGFWSLSAVARQDLVPGSRYTSARIAAMGDAGLPIADDGASALFYNPAAIGKIKKAHFEPWNFSIFGNSGFFDTFRIDSISVPSLSAYSSHLNSFPNVYQGGGFAAAPTFSMRGLAVGMLIQSQVAGVRNPNGSTRYRSKYQIVPTIGGGLRLAEGIIRIGATVQWVNQASGEVTEPSGSTLGWNQRLGQGAGLSFNGGLAVTLPFQYLPAFNLVGRNIGGLKFSGKTIYPMASNSVGAPANEKASFDASISLHPKLGRGSLLNLVGQLRDITQTTSMPIQGRLALGFEFAGNDRFFFRAGLGSGYPSAGIGFRTKRSELSIAWYSEEVGSGFRDQRDAIYMIQYRLRVF